MATTESQPLPTLEAIKLLLREELPRLMKDYSVQSLEVFGSFVRGEESQGSDLDLLVEFDDAPTLFAFVRLENELSSLLDVKVDLVMKDSLKPTIGARILSEAIGV